MFCGLLNLNQFFLWTERHYSTDIRSWK